MWTREKHRGRWKRGRRRVEGREAGVVFPTGVLDKTILHVPRPPHTHKPGPAQDTMVVSE